MPKFTLPDLPEPDEGENKKNSPVAEVSTQGDGVWPSQWERTIRIPVNRKIIEALSVGKDVQVTLRGDVTSLKSEENQGRNCCYLEVMMDSVDAELSDDVDEEAAMDAGYKGD